MTGIGFLVVVVCAFLATAAAGAAPWECNPGTPHTCPDTYQCIDKSCVPTEIVSEVSSALIYVLGAALIAVAFFVVSRRRTIRHQPAGS